MKKYFWLALLITMLNTKGVFAAEPEISDASYSVKDNTVSVDVLLEQSEKAVL